MRSLLVALAISVALILLAAFTGDSDAVDPRNIQDNVARPAGALDAAHTLGQTMVFRMPRLRAIAVRWIVSADVEFAPASRVVLHLRHRASDPAEIASASIALSDLRNNEFAKFSFAPLQDSQDQPFYFFIDASQTEITRGYISLWAADVNDYPDGQMYSNGTAAAGDLAFRAYYDPDLPLMLGALQRAAGRYLTASLIAISIFLSVGLALAALSGILAARSLVENIALAGGLGLAALSAASILLLALRAPVQWLGLIVVAALVMALVSAARARLRQRSHSTPRVARQFNFIDGALAALALLSIAVGFLQIRDAIVPLWKDSPIHAGLISTLLAQGHLPTDSFYHYGFHSIAALLVQWFGATIPVTMLLIGPLLITQCGLSVFLLTKRLTGSARAALVSAVGAWFLSPTPAYFVTWGRYPLLLGAALLPLTLLFVVEYLEQSHFDARTYALMVLVSAGLAFAHVRLAAFALIFAAIYWACQFWRARDARVRSSLIRRAALALGAGVVMSAIWLIPLQASRAALPQMLPPYLSEYALDLSTAVTIPLTQHGVLLLALAAIGAAVALARRRGGVLLMLAWFIALFALAALPVLGDKYLPASLVALIGFLPVSMLVGDLADFLYTKTAADSTRAAVVWGATVMIVAALGARAEISIVNPATILFTDADQNALAWITEHTPADSKFLINSAAWFGPGDSPTDGGWWIPFLTGRAIDFIAQPISPGAPDAETLARWIDSQAINFIYLGSRRGVLQRSDFVCAPDRYVRVYSQDGITIFQVRHAAPTRLAPRAGCAVD